MGGKSSGDGVSEHVDEASSETRQDLVTDLQESKPEPPLAEIDKVAISKGDDDSGVQQTTVPKSESSVSIGAAEVNVNKTIGTYCVRVNQYSSRGNFPLFSLGDGKGILEVPCGNISRCPEDT